jgi:hypothetical protein
VRAIVSSAERIIGVARQAVELLRAHDRANRGGDRGTPARVFSAQTTDMQQSPVLN